MKEMYIYIYSVYRKENMFHEAWTPLKIQVPFEFTREEALRYAKDNYIESKRAELMSMGNENVYAELLEDYCYFIDNSKVNNTNNTLEESEYKYESK